MSSWEFEISEIWGVLRTQRRHIAGSAKRGWLGLIFQISMKPIPFR